MCQESQDVGTIVSDHAIAVLADFQLHDMLFLQGGIYEYVIPGSSISVFSIQVKQLIPS